MGPLGLIAGEGVFPILVARGARAAGRRVVCTAFAGHAGADLAAECDEFHWVGVVRCGQWIRKLKKAGVSEAIMVGRVNKSHLHDRWRYFRYIPDLRTARLFFRVIRRDKRTRSIFTALIDELASEGITLIDSTKYCTDQMASAGVMTRRQPTVGQLEDIRFGVGICQEVARLDIGQCIAVLARDVIAVEAVEGTNATIERAGKVCSASGWTLIKMSTNQEMRVDVPTIGVTTIEKLAAAGAGCLVLEAGRSMMLDKMKVLEMADRHKIAVVGYDPANPGSITAVNPAAT